MSDDPAHDRITAVIRAITTLTTNQPNIVGFDSNDYQYVFREGGPPSLARARPQDRQKKAAPHAQQRQPLLT
jgi:hypothetical protein